MKYDYDDPYILLAHHLIASSTEMETTRLLIDDDYIYRMIVKEVRGQDFAGPFLDTIVGDILENKSRMEMCHELDKLALYFFKKLDLDRLRSEISKYAVKYGILEP